ncbi:MAG TPA: redoxin domain-containing protein, partial [Flavisolibacter sp.]|nr:redoxin domain-containing protein [Flavisolibacter sp.]
PIKNMPMKALILFSFLFLSLFSNGQAAKDKLPAFKMTLSDGGHFSSESLKKITPVMLIYFAPDCGHCQVLMKEFFKRVRDFDRTEVVMVSFKPLPEIAQFVKDYKIANYKNIFVGREEPVFFFRYFYDLVNTPFTALFDKKGKLIQSYKVETPLPELIAKLKKIK